MRKIFHIGLAVPDLQKGMAEIGQLFDLTWRPVRIAKMTFVDSSGRSSDVEIRVTFSLGAPFAVELWEAIPGTPLAMPDSGYFHHIGYWVDDLADEGTRLDKLGYPTAATAGTTVLLKHGPGGLLLEPESVHVDRPSLRDLYPPESEYAGEPVFAPPPEGGRKP
jgi:hypothetical protein